MVSASAGWAMVSASADASPPSSSVSSSSAERAAWVVLRHHPARPRGFGSGLRRRGRSPAAALADGEGMASVGMRRPPAPWRAARADMRRRYAAISRPGDRFGNEHPLVPARESSFSVWPMPKHRKQIFSRVIVPCGLLDIAASKTSRSSSTEWSCSRKISNAECAFLADAPRAIAPVAGSRVNSSPSVAALASKYTSVSWPSTRVELPAPPWRLPLGRG